MSISILQASRYFSRTKSHKPSTKQSFFQELAKPAQRKIELKNLFPSENKKYATALTNTTQTMTVKLNNDIGLQKRTTDRIPAANTGLAQCRLTWLIEHSTSHQFLWCVDSFVLRNPPLRQVPKRQV